MTQYRQGHILLVREKKLPRDAKRAEFTPGHVVIARGETGREHAFLSDRVNLFQFEGVLFAEITGVEPVDLRHEEHDDIDIDPGIWKIVEQREEDPQTRVVRRSYPD